jgi:tetratricopeptide (TPR) repeat protein
MLMGGAYEETANYTEALKFYEKAHAGLVGHIHSDHHRQERHLFDKQHILLMDVYNKMGLLEDRRAHYSAAMTYFGYAMNMTDGLHTSPGPSFWNNSVEYDKHVLGMRFTDRDGYSTAAFSPYAANVNSNKAHVHFMRGEYTDAIDQCDISTNIRVDELDTDEHNSIGWNHFLRAKAEDDNGACDTNSYKAARDIYNVVLGPRHSQSMAVGALQTCA